MATPLTFDQKVQFIKTCVYTKAAKELLSSCCTYDCKDESFWEMYYYHLVVEAITYAEVQNILTPEEIDQMMATTGCLKGRYNITTGEVILVKRRCVFELALSTSPFYYPDASITISGVLYTFSLSNMVVAIQYLNTLAPTKFNFVNVSNCYLVVEAYTSELLGSLDLGWYDYGISPECVQGLDNTACYLPPSTFVNMREAMWNYNGIDATATVLTINLNGIIYSSSNPITTQLQTLAFLNSINNGFGFFYIGDDGLIHAKGTLAAYYGNIVVSHTIGLPTTYTVVAVGTVSTKNLFDFTGLFPKTGSLTLVADNQLFQTNGIFTDTTDLVVALNALNNSGNWTVVSPEVIRVNRIYQKLDLTADNFPPFSNVVLEKNSGPTAIPGVFADIESMALAIESVTNLLIYYENNKIFFFNNINDTSLISLDFDSTAGVGQSVAWTTNNTINGSIREIQNLYICESNTNSTLPSGTEIFVWDLNGSSGTITVTINGAGYTMATYDDLTNLLAAGIAGCTWSNENTTNGEFLVCENTNSLNVFGDASYGSTDITPQSFIIP